MEGKHVDSAPFDRLVRPFGQTRPRRQTQQGLAGATAAGALVVGRREASADLCKSSGKACKTDGQCCSGLVCVNSGSRTNSPKKNSNACQDVATCTAIYQACDPITAKCCDTYGAGP